ncbi:hypothetical protein HW555_009377 [Spodoptera exigua]|uniref:C2H2-type domain-containing protein n=1 Tax=Spodoptera exigua TaxID=7107 RepID=A0A835L2I5_SPOEX|nr:hypothetical protein HW555_009377 [Spodoptera exigua]
MKVYIWGIFFHFLATLQTSNGRTCLSKSDLKQLFPDKNLVSLRIEQLLTVCGIKLICESCLNLFNGALKLRELSSKSEEILKKSLKTIKIEFETIENKSTTKELGKNKNLQQDDHKQNKKVEKKRFNISKDDFSVDNDVPVRIEDFESSDSLDEEFKNVIKNETKDFNKINYWDSKEKEFLERENRKQQTKEQDAKLLSLAALPYTQSGPLKCTLCNKVLRNVQNFKSHAKTHFEPQNACEECGKKFVNPSHMRYHQQRNHIRAAHTGERPYVCDVCGDSFRMRANIAQHMRRHFGVRNLQMSGHVPQPLRADESSEPSALSPLYLPLLPLSRDRPASVKKHLANVHGIQRHLQLPVKCVKTKRSSCDGPD